MKKENIILAVVIASLVFYIATTEKNKNNYILPQLDEVKTSEITEINLSKNEQTISIKKKNNSWVLTDKGYPADQGKIDNMLDAIKKIELTALVSEKNDLSRYKLDPQNSIRVQAKKADKVLREFDIGKTAPTYNHTFIRLEGNQNIYQARGDLKPHFDKIVSQLRDKSVLSFDSGAIKKILVSKKDITKSFSQEVESKSETDDNKKDKKISVAKETKINWKSKDSQTADAKAIEELINTLKTLECDEYTKIEEKDSFWNKQVACKITIKGTNELVIFEKENDKYPAISSDNAYPFLLSTYNGENIIDLVNKILGIKKKENKDAAKTK